MKVNTAMAEQFAEQARHGTSWDRERLRDWLDGKTGGDLGYHALNILTDMVWSRIQKQPLPTPPAKKGKRVSVDAIFRNPGGWLK